MENKIKQTLEKIRPQLQADGGDVEFIEFDETTGILKVKLQGACSSCPMAQGCSLQPMCAIIKE